MALGDYVRTAAGAVAKGASAIVAAILNRGGTGQEASAALAQTFPSLSGQVIGGLVSGTRRQLAAGQTQFRGGALAGAPSLEIVGIGNVPTAQRVLIQATVTGSEGAISISSHWVDMQPGQTLENAANQVRGSLSLIYEGTDSPELAEEMEGEEVVDVETRTLLIQQRIGG
jgi:hypothetical protein